MQGKQADDGDDRHQKYQHAVADAGRGLDREIAPAGREPAEGGRAEERFASRSARAAAAEQRPVSTSSSVSLQSHRGVHDDFAALNFPSFASPSPWRRCATQSGCDIDRHIDEMRIGDQHQQQPGADRGPNNGLCPELRHRCAGVAHRSPRRRSNR